MATLRGGAPGIWWTQASDAAKHLTIHRTAPPTKRDPAPNVTSARGEKPGCRMVGLRLECAQGHLEGLLNLHCWTPLPEFLIKSVWGGA